MKLKKYDTIEEYKQDTNNKLGQTDKGLPKGCVVTYRELFSDYLYPLLYCWEFDSKTKNKEYVETNGFVLNDVNGQTDGRLKSFGGRNPRITNKSRIGFIDQDVH